MTACNLVRIGRLTTLRSLKIYSSGEVTGVWAVQREKRWKSDAFMMYVKANREFLKVRRGPREH